MLNKFQDSPNTNWKIKTKEGKNYRSVNLTFMGRDAIALLLKNIEPTFFKVLLPAYTCTEVSDQFLQHGFEIVYYDTDHFKIDGSEISNLLKEHRFDMFYFIRYFGMRPHDIDSMISSIKDHDRDIFIVEDRAHYLSDKPLEKDIDAYIYSFRKLLPIPEGGGLQTDLPLKFQYKNRSISTLLALLMVVKKRFIGHNPTFSRSNISTVKSQRHDYQNNDIIKVMPPSFMSERIIKYYDLEENRKLRRELFKIWLDSVLDFENITPLFTKLSKEDIPQGFPIIVKDAAELHRKMFQEGIYLKRHWPLDSSFEMIAPKAYSLSRQLITLPIYEHITPSDIEMIIKKVAEHA